MTELVVHGVNHSDIGATAFGGSDLVPLPSEAISDRPITLTEVEVDAVSGGTSDGTLRLTSEYRFL